MPSCHRKNQGIFHKDKMEMGTLRSVPHEPLSPKHYRHQLVKVANFCIRSTKQDLQHANGFYVSTLLMMFKFQSHYRKRSPGC